jgi:hypothetical protein
MFLTRLSIEDADEPDQWVVIRPLVWSDPVYGWLIVPAGTKTDLASIPRFLRDWRAFDPNGPSRRAAVLHDWLYADGTRGKEFADNCLRAALLAEGVTPKVAAAFYWAVRLFAGPAWRGHRASAQPV